MNVLFDFDYFFKPHGGTQVCIFHALMNTFELYDMEEIFQVLYLNRFLYYVYSK